MKSYITHDNEFVLRTDEHVREAETKRQRVLYHCTKNKDVTQLIMARMTPEYTLNPILKHFEEKGPNGLVFVYSNQAELEIYRDMVMGVKQSPLQTHALFVSRLGRESSRFVLVVSSSCNVVADYGSDPDSCVGFINSEPKYRYCCALPATKEIGNNVRIVYLSNC